MRGAAVWFCVSLVAPAAMAEPAPAVVGAKAFVESVYAAYEQPDASSSLGKRADVIYAPALLSELRADQTAHAGEVGRLDHDPLCDCQDSDGLKLGEVEVTQAEGGRVDAAIRFKLGDVGKSVRLRLVSTPGGWRVGDVSTAAMGSLVGVLEGK